MEPDRQHDGPERLDHPTLRPSGRRLTPAEIRAAVLPRLTPRRRAHVEKVAETIERLTAGWSETGRGDAWRAAWYHDAWKCDPLDEMLTEIRAGGEEPDAWAVRHAPVLIHAQAAAVWARRTMGERNAEVLTAVRHHPTGHAEWGDLGRVLFVSDFCEPGRPFAESLGTARLVERAAESSTALAEVALEVLAIRLGRALAARRPIHPDGWHAWNGWTEAAGS